MGLLYGRAGRLSTENGGFRPGQIDEVRPGQSNVDVTISIYGEASANAAAPSTTDFDMSSPSRPRPP